MTDTTVTLDRSAADPKLLLRTHFGMQDFRSGQLEVIDTLLAGRSAVAVFPTGGGKSLCYQLPALAFSGVTVVVSPLIALMKDQCDALAARGIKAARLDSTLTTQEFSQAMRGIRAGEIKIVYVAPERFFNERFRASIEEWKISLFAIDEAHCISQWGHSFRSDYLKLAEVARELQVARVLALTATATPSVLDDIRAAFSISPQDAVRTPFFRANLILRATPVSEQERDSTLVDRLKNSPQGPTLIYVTLQKTAVEVAEQLAAEGFPARPYHAGMDAEVRSEIQQWFLESNDGIVVATIAFGMGIDKPNIRYVYHYNPAKSLEAYAQEVGRAGRDGQESVCESLIVAGDKTVLDNFAYGDTPERNNVRRLVEFLAAQGESYYLSLYHLSNDMDIRPLVLRTLITYLELDGFIKSTSPRYDSYQFRPLTTSKVILSHFEGERKEFISGILCSATKARTWFKVPIAVAARRLGQERSRIVKALCYLEERGWLELQVSDLVHGYRRVNEMTDPIALADSLYERIIKREASDIHRTEQVFEMLRAGSCMAAMLSGHFGEQLDQACGRCDACEGKGPYPQSTSGPLGVGRGALAAIRELQRRHPQQLATARQQARFLCGLTTPSLTRSKLTRDAHFGVCASVPFSVVVSALEKQ